jgi:hypothetical protein
MPSRERGIFLWRTFEAKCGNRRRCFPVTLEELIPCDHMCRVSEAFVGGLNMAKLGFVRSEPAETGRPGYDARDLLKLYLYGLLAAGAVVAATVS